MGAGGQARAMGRSRVGDGDAAGVLRELLPNRRAGALIGPAWQPQRRVEALVALQRARGDAGRPAWHWHMQLARWLRARVDVQRRLVAGISASALVACGRGGAAALRLLTRSCTPATPLDRRPA
jgi:hypothetical protein